jgi:signal transduction histidine kinase
MERVRSDEPVRSKGSRSARTGARWLRVPDLRAAQRRSMVRTWAMALVMGLAAAGLVSAAMGLRFRLADAGLEARENAQWVVSQVRVEHLRLVQQAMRVQAGEADADSLPLRVDIFAGRVTVLGEAPILIGLRKVPPVAAMLAQARAAVEAIDAQGLAQDPAAIRRTMEPLAEPMQAALLATLAYAIDRQKTRYDAMTDLVFWTGVATMALVFGVIAFAVVALVQLGRLQEANAAKTRFLATMSHELRTPLNAIIGFADMMRGPLYRSIPDAKKVEYLDDIHSSGTHLLSLIDDILDLSRIEAGRIGLTPTSVDPRTVVKEALHSLQVPMREKAISLRFLAPATLPSVLADRRALLQILLNLLSNAVKFSPPSGGRVVLRTRTIDDDAIEFTVENRGPAMPAAVRARLGEPFLHDDDPSRAVGRGAGLGLAICVRLAEAMDGKLRIDDRTDGWTRVRLTLPIARAVRG